MKKKISVLFLVMLISNQVDVASETSDLVPFLLSGYCSKEAIKKVLESESEYFGLTAGAQEAWVDFVSCQEIDRKVLDGDIIRSESIASDIIAAFLDSKVYRRKSGCHIKALKQGIASLEQSKIDLKDNLLDALTKNDRLNEKLVCLLEQNIAFEKQKESMMAAYAQLRQNLSIAPKVKKAHHNSGGVFSGHSQYSQPPSNSSSIYGCSQEVWQRSSVSAFHSPSRHSRSRSDEFVSLEKEGLPAPIPQYIFSHHRQSRILS